MVGGHEIEIFVFEIFLMQLLSYQLKAKWLSNYFVYYLGLRSNDGAQM